MGNEEGGETPGETPGAGGYLQHRRGAVCNPHAAPFVGKIKI